jgi:hypothetical protein
MEADRVSAAYVRGRVELLLADVKRVVDSRTSGSDANLDDPYFGLYVSGEEVDRLLSSRPALTREPGHQERASRVQELTARLDNEDGPTRATTLAEEFGLDRIDLEVLFVALAPDIDPRFERLYGFLNDDVSRKRPTIGLAFELCQLEFTDAEGRARFGPHSPLVAGGLLRVDDEQQPFLARPLSVPDRVTSFLLGDDRIDSGLAAAVVGDATGDGGVYERLVAFVKSGRPLVYIRDGAGRDAIGMALSALAAAGRPYVVLDLRRPKPEAIILLAAVAGRECRLTGAALVAGPIDLLGDQAWAVVRSLTDQRCAVILSGRRGWDPDWSSRVPLLLDAPEPDHLARSAQWRRELNGFGGGEDWDPAIVTAQFHLSHAQISRAAAAASLAVRYGGGVISAADLTAGARAQNAAGLERLARRVEPAVGWGDLILPAGPMTALRDLAARARTRDTVLGDWGMRPGAARGRGISALLAGDSGTGKTMSAEVVAKDLGLDLYVVNLATVVDKYVGETEKNLERIFTEADGVNGVLLFDEADALFGKRSEVRDARDRYANIEVAYLLQRMESFDGLALLSTNLRANVDEAFARRLDAVIDFPMPDASYRRILWERCLGTDAPLAGDLDLDFCAQRFVLSGGNIRSITLSAAYRAADAARAITMEDLMVGTVGEYRKLGRLCDPSEFGAWFALAVRM